ncbi:MAG: shikimate dehydrogenase [Ruminococcaceae bacterium]|nr:shikimate dehydrogenase [Oscillospiraceae bacterium]
MNHLAPITTYGCIAEHLGHSFSGEIHRLLSQALAAKDDRLAYQYHLQELRPDEVEGFFRRRAFCGINITIPYKQVIIPMLDELTDVARDIGAVNTVVNRDGRLIGDNTDFYGMRYLLFGANIDLSEKKVLIFGTGGTSNTAFAVAKHGGAKQILKFSRTARDGALSYDDLPLHTDADVIINTTPAGMYPNDEGCPLPEGLTLADFPALCGVVDAIYHPLRTELIMAARQLGIPATGGLPMLVAQAAAATERFLDCTVDAAIIADVVETLQRQKENIVLIGMPGCGKTTVGNLLSECLGRPLLDTDEAIARRVGSVPDYLRAQGEAAFRDLEAAVIREDIAPESGVIIATGGGAVLRDENVRRLKRNGTLVFLDRPLSALMATPDRPLSSDPDALRRRFEERYDRYCAVADVHLVVPDGESAEETVERVRETF